MEFNESIQLVSVESTWSSATLLEAVNIIGILKNTLLTPGGEYSMRLLLTLTPLHSGKRRRRRETNLDKSVNFLIFVSIVLLVRPPGKL